ncbi:MAG: acyl-CoA thioesterase [Alistipes sp.]|nr:acyl-CoA thioesterase [Alistipes sp.]
MISHDTQIRVLYKHTDQMGVVHHSNYINFFEAARTELMREIGLTYAEVERRGIMMPILDVHIKYRQPALYDEIITVRASVAKMPMARVDFDYEVTGEDGRSIATGTTTLGFIDSVTRRPQRAPQWLVEVLRPYVE